MLKQKWMAVVVGAALAAGAAVSYAALPEGSDVVAREAAEGPRGGDNERPGDRQRRGGHGLTADAPSNFVIAREAAEGPRGADNERPGDRQRRGGREAGDDRGGRGADDRGGRGGRDDRSGRRHGLGSQTPADLVIAREASEGPRGADNERPGDRQRGRRA